MRFVVLLREPVSREMSRFNHHLQHPERLGIFRKKNGFILSGKHMLSRRKGDGRDHRKKGRNTAPGLWNSFHDERLAEAGRLFGHKDVRPPFGSMHADHFA